MGFTKKQIAIFMKDKFLFKFSINPEYLIKYNQNEEYTFDEIEKIIKSNLEYWESIPNNNFVQKWQELSNRVNSVRKYLSSIEDLDMKEVDSFIYSRLSSVDGVKHPVVLFIECQLIHQLTWMRGLLK